MNLIRYEYNIAIFLIEATDHEHNLAGASEEIPWIVKMANTITEYILTLGRGLVLLLTFVK